MPVSQTSLDDVLRHVTSKLEAHKSHQRSRNAKPRPFVLGLSGMQGSGKSTWARSLADMLRTRHRAKIVILSLDDLYHTHESLAKIRSENSSNELFRNRGQPGTHDEVLAEQFFKALFAGEAVAVPLFDKSRFNGEGDRAPVTEWEQVSRDPPVDVVIFEGWCIGFQALSDQSLEEKWNASRQTRPNDATEELPTTMLMREHPLEHLRLINSNLARYNETFLNPSKFDYLIHLDTSNLSNVYHWRIQQEHALRESKGTGMTDEEVIKFVQVYMPAYELYLERLKEEPFIPHNASSVPGKNQLCVILDENRRVVSVNEV